MPVVTDEDAALQATSALDSLSDAQKAAKSQIDRVLHAAGGNPFVDIHELFPLYDVLYFRGRLSGNVEVSWSRRLTLCAGICELLRDDRGKYKPIRLKLSEALLKYRPREDIVDTLLHENTPLLTDHPGSIHAYLFLTTSYRHSRASADDDGHGPGFLLLANAINAHANTNIASHHAFHAEVDSYRTHIWQCSGPCRQKPPYFGLVKRAMNRPPGKSDSWFARHQEECGGAWTKISEPEPKQPKSPSPPSKSTKPTQKNNLDGWIKKKAPTAPARANISTKRPLDHPAAPPPAPTDTKKKLIVSCPICNATMPDDTVNEHLDLEHPP